MKTIQPEWYFLAVALPIAVTFLLLTPPIQAPDENAHFLRAYQLSEGHIVSVKIGDRTGDTLPSQLMTFIDRFHELRFHPENKTTFNFILASDPTQFDSDQREFMMFSNTAIHPPLTYVPQSLGIFIARRFTNSLLTMFYLGRFFNLAAGITLMFIAIRRTPMCKWVFVILALTPMSLFLTASLSSDTLTNALAFLVIAQTLHVVFAPGERVSTPDLILMAVLGAAIGQTKQAYFLLPASYLLIPIAKFGNGRRYCVGFALIMTTTLLSVASWGLIVRGIYSPANTEMGLNPSGQILFMMSDPGRFAFGILDCIRQFPMYLCQYVGVLGWLDTRLPQWLLFVELGLIALTILNETDSRFVLSWRQSLLAIAIAACVGFTVLFIIYVTWEPVGSRFIRIQGRYFIPVGPLVGLAVPRLRLPFTKRLHAATCIRMAVATAIPLLLIVTSVTLHSRYFATSP